MSTTASREETIERLKEQIEETEKPVSKVSQANAPEKDETRSYVVLIEDEDQHIFTLVNTVAASSAQTALKSLGEDLEELPYVVVPLRSWNRLTPKVKKTTTISFE